MLPGSGSSACKLTPLIHYPPSAGVCFQEPVLQAADLEEEETGPLAPSASAPPPKHESLESRIATQLTSEPVPAAPRVRGCRARRPPSAGRCPPAWPCPCVWSTASGAAAAASRPGRPHARPARRWRSCPPSSSATWPRKGSRAHRWDQTWAPLAGRHDVQAVAEPGAGKTLTFLLPAAALLEGAAKVPAATATVLVLEQARELAQQVGLVWKDLARLTGAQAAVIHGGVPRQACAWGGPWRGGLCAGCTFGDGGKMRSGVGWCGGVGGAVVEALCLRQPKSPPITALPTPASTPPLLKELLVMHTPVARDRV